METNLYIDDNTGAVDLDINPSNPNELYAAMWYKTRLPGNLWKAEKQVAFIKAADGGETWNWFQVRLPVLSIEKIGRIGIAVYPKNPNYCLRYCR
jgi:hypothetical protein